MQMNRINTWILKIYIKSILNPFIFNNDLRRGEMSKKNLLYTKVIFGFLKIGGIICDAPNPGCPLTTRQPAENLYVSYRETHT